MLELGFALTTTKAPRAAFDYYVDAAAGSDASPGTAAAPFATLTRLGEVATTLNQPGFRKSALVRAGAYTGGQKFVINNGTLDAVFTLVFEPGCTMVGVPGQDNSAFDIISNASDGSRLTVNIFGNGLDVAGYDTGTGNGFGVSGAGRLFAYDIVSHGNVDGFSVHGASFGRATRCRFYGNSKSAIGHVNTATAEHVDCVIETAAGNTGNVVEAGCTALFERCTFVDGGGGGINFNGACTVRNSTLGTTTTPFVFFAPNANTLIEDSFIHTKGDANQFAGTFRRCRGRFAIRHRNGGSRLTLENCILAGAPVGTASGQRSLLWANFNPGGGTPLTVRDCILTGYLDTTIGHGFDGTVSPQLVSAGLVLGPMAAYGTGAPLIDADIVAASGYVAPSPLVTANPLLGPMTTTARSAWGVGAGSPCLGAGTAGGDIGFGA